MCCALTGHTQSHARICPLHTKATMVAMSSPQPIAGLPEYSVHLYTDQHASLHQVRVVLPHATGQIAQRCRPVQALLQLVLLEEGLRAVHQIPGDAQLTPSCFLYLAAGIDTVPRFRAHCCTDHMPRPPFPHPLYYTTLPCGPRPIPLTLMPYCCRAACGRCCKPHQSSAVCCARAQWAGGAATRHLQSSLQPARTAAVP